MFKANLGLILNKLLFKHDKSSNDLILGLRRPYYLKRKKALLSYIPSSVHSFLEGKKTVRFSNDGIAICWARALTALGYELDIITWNDTNFKIKKDYDLFICHGGVNFDRLYEQFKKIPKIIYFATGNYWALHNSQEIKRVNNFNKKYKTDYKPDRLIKHSEERANTLADGIIALGNSDICQGFPNSNILNINNASYSDNHFYQYVRYKNFKAAKKNFMYFAGSGNVHKGLDLLLEAFYGRKENLYVVGEIKPEFYKIMKKFFNEKNIHKIGEVNMRSKEFYTIVDQCASVLLPSCSEGQAGSVVECMNQGLIPVVSRETRLDTGNFGYVLNNCTKTEIEKVIGVISNSDVKSIYEKSINTKKQTEELHSEASFLKRLKECITKIATT